jgi:hypothetical protein
MDRRPARQNPWDNVNHESPVVLAVSRDGEHRFSKVPAASINLIAGISVEGDAHSGRTVQHRSRVAADPTQPNLRQVHLMNAELFDELREKSSTFNPASSARTSPRQASTCSACRPARGRFSGRRPSLKSLGCATRACRSTLSARDCCEPLYSVRPTGR